MLNKVKYALSALVVLGLCSGARAQYVTRTISQKTEDGRSTITTKVFKVNGKKQRGTVRAAAIMGCLRKGDAPGKYLVTGANGNTYALIEGGDVMLSEHVGHQVNITGTNISEEGKAERKVSKGEGELAGEARAEIPGQNIWVRVNGLQDVSSTCP